ncbi:MAG: hypothetical protein HY518_02360 [Candidatus Aenigmarchaeota archaeon]|nr:hypothetical protein [Candidatus Aenigmarchaeota archaeon]
MGKTFYVILEAENPAIYELIRDSLKDLAGTGDISGTIQYSRGPGSTRHRWNIESRTEQDGSCIQTRLERPLIFQREYEHILPVSKHSGKYRLQVIDSLLVEQLYEQAAVAH